MLTVSRYIDKNRTGACGLGRNRRLLRHTVYSVRAKSSFGFVSIQYPSFPMVEALSSPVFNMTIPESSAPRLKQKKVRLGLIAKELALFELFLRNNSRNSRDRQFWLFLVCLSMEEALFRITATSANFLQNWFGLRFCLQYRYSC